MQKKRLRSIWTDMWRRCTQPHRKCYKKYGGRGISVCDEWADLNCFIEWAVNNGYQPDLTLDRRDNDGNYDPGNCRWVTVKDQDRNRSNNVKITHNGITHCLSEWAEIAGITPAALWMRINRHGWAFERAISQSGPNNRTGLKGVSQPVNCRGKPFRAYITKDGKRKHLGCFWTKEEASAAVVAAREAA
jgi:hypothetical protein